MPRFAILAAAALLLAAACYDWNGPVDPNYPPYPPPVGGVGGAAQDGGAR
jgi:hypothetical protein